MSFLKDSLIGMAFLSVVLMPMWIQWIRRASWPLVIKKLVIVAMALVSTLFTVGVISRPNPYPATRIAGTIAILLYLTLVLVITYYTWRRLT